MKIKAIFLSFILMCVLALPAAAADTDRQYKLSLAVNGQHQIYAGTGDILTVTALLERTDTDQRSTMYGFQDEIRYDDEFIHITDGMTITAADVKTNDIALTDGDRAFYINYLSLDGQNSWQPKTLLASFQIKVTADKGATKLKNENVIISVPDGSDTYRNTVNDLVIIVSSDCTVKFDCKGGSEISPQDVQIGGLINKPADPQREGYVFMGWYSDPALTEQWEFDTDTVETNMTLYAKWQSAAVADTATDDTDFPVHPVFVISAICLLILLLASFSRKTVTYMVDGKEYMKAIVKKNSKLVPPQPPVTENRAFSGWYKDEQFIEKWDFANDTVQKSIRLFAKF